MEYLTVNSTLRVSVRGFTKQDDADAATFLLQRKDNQKKVVDQSATQATKTSSLNPLTWEIAVDEDLIKAALTDDEMQCNVAVSITAGEKTWNPSGQHYVIYRNKITLSAKDKDNANLAGARCTCTIRRPADCQPASQPGERHAPNTVTTKDDGTAELLLDAPGELDLEWAYPYYPQDNAAWTALTGVKRETVLLERERKARFIWPDVAKGEEQKHFGPRLRIEAGVDGGVAGDKIYLTVELTSTDTADASGEPLKCKLEGQDLEVGKAKTTLTLTLDDDGEKKVAELDFNDYGGITAKLGVSTVEGSTDETVDVTSWRKVDVQPYHPAPGFFPGDTIPEGLTKKVKECFDEVFIEVEFLKSKDLFSGFPGVELDGKFEVVRSSKLVYFKMGKFVASTPLDWIMQFAGAAGTKPHSALQAIFANGSYETREVPVSLILSGDSLVSQPQTSTAVLTAKNIDPKENHGEVLLPWSSGDPSYWQVVGRDTRNKVTMEFIEINQKKTEEGVHEYKIKLPDGAKGDPKALAAAGEKIKLNVKLRGYEFGVASASHAPFLYIGLDSDYTSARSAYTAIHELAHALGFAPSKGEFFYGVSGRHCANGIKSDAEAYVRENQGTVGATVGETLSKGLAGRNVPLELAAAGKFGTCVMWGHTDRQKTTEDLFGAALKFCSACAALIRVTPLSSSIGG